LPAASMREARCISIARRIALGDHAYRVERPTP
jgi:hypothetical protein